ncbi:hypothetical protein PspLS_06853 [Pyricularia sp. CBS 133598]|nr:hypothetical protein PspLS_06853 [Pyricularia sp. CBS 133598]
MHVDEVMQRIPGAGSEIPKEANRTGFCGSRCKHGKVRSRLVWIAKGLGGPGRMDREPNLCSSRNGWQMAFNGKTYPPDTNKPDGGLDGGTK